MALFSKKNKEDEYEDEEELVPRRKSLRNRDFKDLKPENRKKRKEPPKPWGKTERLLVLLVLILTAGTSSFLALQSRGWKLPGLPRLKIPSISIPFLGEKTIIIEGDKKNQGMKEKATVAFKSMTKELSGVYGLYVLRLDDGSNYGVNENEIFQAASLIKLPVIFAMYKEAEGGNIDLDNKYRLKRTDKVAGSGSLYQKSEGYLITYREMVRLMGKQSDNTAFNILVKLLGKDKIESVIKELGMIQTSLDKNETTPEDVGIFFDRLYNGNLISDASTNEILEDLTDTIYEDWLVAGIPGVIRVAHKYGRELHIVNDAGIILSDKPFVLVIMSKGIVEKEADEIFPVITRAVYEIETGGF
ncbi:hypothetical protein A2962_03875 [Candidatus Woesebacteria bacterium RIFCSPLOWO2_01_FULL_39_61]|uniref:Beta-lactamase class A catalytic domain-containing protein n=1 Tax=Candidatus Woesebacteria bacterium RIFCSPHIGHO2_02_FULL_39_13 TaxID=1802505 RepID=A0A1F7Z314_9BACT|nr:MAG: hypothetical protein A2692_02195 [Candidatus Woesebacteria bacterium RIFCSPHIGHO2_01_FULL_39_95]OGM33921.1 MAG: hypothetical protein A3D01_05880 [Candidatus Woesebacteria bacterium RIFCSPHIGHO2_02_FULL_39_13]OGM37210.1 MAG: hypothetical protein A3E13_03210 [Candidatus Woesebacteria bacterium RIFCSPHIGHO2_12_FULL_40_20]OGM65895.1 MAG: hypothetical protein A2962_03875 [Candidatus Woesebacteria bacterium RIFCSPLOWO2_01_FULL_39_61]OGM74131.1 MAG: hypothetical protein A3H19_03740 [Candidatus